jgi:site-specific recombinase XerD
MLKFFEGITGQFTISDNGASVDNVVKGALKRALARHPKFRHIKGFHTFRHSVCSILASKGVDQRYIDKIVGHCTLAQTLRYQHLLPKGTTVAISQLL